MAYTNNMEELLSKLPPWLDLPEGRAWLTLSTWDEGWQACYVGDGYALNGYNEFGRTSSEALLHLKETIDLLRLLEAPSGKVEETVRKPKTLGEASPDK